MKKESLLSLLNDSVSNAKNKIESSNKFSFFDESQYFEVTRLFLAKKCYENFLFFEGLNLLENVVEEIEEPYLKAEFYYYIGKFQHLSNELMLASLSYVKSLVVCEEQKFDCLKNRLFLCLAVIFILSGDLNKSKSYIDMIDKKQIGCQIDDKQLYDISKIFVEGILQNKKNSGQELEKYLSYFKKDMGSIIFITANIYLGLIYKNEGLSVQAISILNNLLDYIKKENIPLNIYMSALIYLLLANLYSDSGNFKCCLSVCETVLEKLSGVDDRILIEKIILIKAKCLISLRRKKEAFDLLKGNLSYEKNMFSEINKKMSKIIDFHVNKLLEQKEIFSMLKDAQDLEDSSSMFDKRSRTRNKIDNFNLLNSYMFGISKLKNLEELYSFSYEFLSRILHFEVFFVAYLDDTRSFIRFEHSDASAGSEQTYSLPLYNPSISRDVILSGKRAILSSEFNLDVENNDTLYYKDSESEKQSGIYIPLENETEVFGVISIQTSKKDFYTEIDIELFEAFSSIFCGSVNFIEKENKIRDFIKKNRQLNQDLSTKLVEFKSEKYKDPVTGFFNKDVFKKEFFKLLEDIEHPIDLTLIIFDIDKLKDFNRVYGNLAGDEFLSYLAVVLKENFEIEGVYFYRFGVQLYIFIVNADKKYVLDKLVDAHQKIMVYVKSLDINISTGVSTGIYNYRVSNFYEIESLITETEVYLRKAKQSGGSSVRMGGDYENQRTGIYFM